MGTAETVIPLTCNRCSRPIAGESTALFVARGELRAFLLAYRQSAHVTLCTRCGLDLKAFLLNPPTAP